MNPGLVYVVGPSGAGKDSLLTWLRARWPSSVPVHWVQRTITRPSNAGGEDHEAVAEADFETMVQDQIFALHWDANGLRYGIRASQLATLRQGHWVMLNGSRAHLHRAAQQYPGLTVLHITADPQVLRQRLLGRGRETAEALEVRLSRVVDLTWPAGCRLIEIHNNESLEQAGQALLMALQDMEDRFAGSSEGAKPNR